MKYTKEKRSNCGFSLVELIIVIAIMAILIGVLTPMYISHMHKVKVTADWANLRNYFTELQVDYVSTGQHNPNVLTTDSDDPASWEQREIRFLDGHTATMKAGYFAVTKERTLSGYQIAYYCDDCLKDWDKHSESCILVLK